MEISEQRFVGTSGGGEPSGSLTIDAGNNRKLVLVVVGEDGTNWSVTTMTVGGQSASSTLSVVESGAGFNTSCRGFVWDETAIAAMSGTTISYADDVAVDYIAWAYLVVDDADQSADSWADTQTGDDPTITTGGTSADLVYLFGAHPDGTLGVSDWDTGMTEIWVDDLTSFEGDAASGAGGDSPYTLVVSGSSSAHAFGGLVLSPAAGGVTDVNFSGSNRGIMRGVGRGVG